MVISPSEIGLQIRKHTPLVLQITNRVTVHDCAAVTAAVGASPVMSDDPTDAAELMRVSDALLINLGTVNEQQVNVICAAADEALAAGKPVVLDPAGVGSSLLRKSIAQSLIKSYRVTVIKGNAGEIAALAGVTSKARGVDAAGSIDRTAVSSYARECGCVVAVTGPADMVSDGYRMAEIGNGVPLMGKVTGTGCMAGSVIAAAVGAGIPAYDAAAGSLAVLGIAGERAVSVAQGFGSFLPAFLDACSQVPETGMDILAKIREDTV